jgi:hypothetical protein
VFDAECVEELCQHGGAPVDVKRGKCVPGDCLLLEVDASGCVGELGIVPCCQHLRAKLPCLGNLGTERHAHDGVLGVGSEECFEGEASVFDGHRAPESPRVHGGRVSGELGERGREDGRQRPSKAGIVSGDASERSS